MTIEKWSKMNYIKVNKAKSAAMIIRADARTPRPLTKTIMSIPEVSSTKYLGIHIDDTATATPVTQKLKTLLK